MSRISEILGDIKTGEEFEDSYNRILKNMRDSATDPKAKRKISIDITFCQDSEREILTYDVQIKEKLAPKLVKKQMESIPLPGQMSITDYLTSDERIERIKENIRIWTNCSEMAAVDMETGEIISEDDPEEE